MRTARPVGRMRACADTAARTAASAEEKAAAIPSPIVAKTSPPVASTASRSTAKWSSTRPDISGDSSHCRVEPSMSVNRNVTVVRDRRGGWRAGARGSPTANFLE